MKAFFASIFLVGSIAAVSVFAAPPASAPETAPKPAMRSMSPMTTSNMAVVPPQRADDVWVNTSSKVYHCPGNRWYGRTPVGAYMSEADAKRKGFKAEKSKACS